MKILVIINVNLIQGFWLYLKIPFFVKAKVKLGQENWWTKLTNNTVIDSLYNFQNKISLLSQLKLHCIGCSYFVFVSWFSFSRSETSSIVKKCGVKILGRTVASKCLMFLPFFRKIAWPWIMSIKFKVLATSLVSDIKSNLLSYDFHNASINQYLQSLF